MAKLTGLRLKRARASPRFRDGRFHNTHPVGPGLQGNQLSIMGEFFFGGRARRPPAPLPVERPHEAWARPVSSDGLRVTWLGHSTTLLELDGARVLTDPVFADRASPVRFAGPRRFHAVPSTIAELPALDAVLVSHDHFDHLCQASVRELAARGVPFVTSLGVGAYLEAFGVAPERITELDWWETAVVGGVGFTATPSQHFSGRGLTSRNRTQWSSWVMESARRRLFFSGDTGLTDEFRTIAERCGPFDLTMLEIGAWHPAWGQIHLGPRNALAAFEMLGGGTLMPVHWGTFDLGLHPWAEPIETLLAEAGTARIVTPILGRPFEPAHERGPAPWWSPVEAPVATPVAAT